MLAKVVSIDEEFEKGRGKDIRPRKKRGKSAAEYTRKKNIERNKEIFGTDTTKQGRKRRGRGEAKGFDGITGWRDEG